MRYKVGGLACWLLSPDCGSERVAVEPNGGQRMIGTVRIVLERQLDRP